MSEESNSETQDMELSDTEVKTPTDSAAPTPSKKISKSTSSNKKTITIAKHKTTFKVPVANKKTRTRRKTIDKINTALSSIKAFAEIFENIQSRMESQESRLQNMVEHLTYLSDLQHAIQGQLKLMALHSNKIKNELIRRRRQFNNNSETSKKK